MSKWLEFKENSDKTIGVWNKKTSDFIGLIYYYAKWRQYIFMPDCSMSLIFNDECLRDILNQLTRMKIKNYKRKHHPKFYRRGNL